VTRTQLSSENYGQGLTKRDDLNIDELGSAVIRKVLAGPGIRLVSTGVDAGTGDVTIKIALQDILTKQFLTANGTAGGSSAMNVNGSGTPVPFWLPADAANDLYLDKIILLIEASALDFKQFGNIAALTNGFDLILKQGGVSVSLIDKAKTTYQILKQTAADFNVITKADASNNEGIIISYELDSARLIAASTDEIRAIVNDNLSTLVSFTAKAIIRRLA